ncbi:haloacid dehalogenase superfamily protein KNAG_0A07080 [Huiozyma naganishii CBS 8797]|uniref:Uncharacterized protein n=1 Tax=Huiozyma naganishii (strain ATCC MYA-139 / BCRC 22969 / CBS 8797 / KCTC 17520 / NBRC 10181 / NCYC 3082 / Yp74L-3) TaxID=1071383 RepID=J7RU66_HUIN7|nr:hypothetical protein KNAG_0A07080 [Kazachstania naganishii CBS 8797]CCK68362.1 hypothetical protein KNAG_0A07080 [Kazachstania naganishii CBS 8797]
MTIDKSIKACLFDMDGLLLNTEDIYTLTCNEILNKYGKGPLTWDIKLKLQGLPGREAGEKLIESYDLPISFEEYDDMNVKSQESKWPTSSFLPGVVELLKYLHEKNIPTAVCTSSNKLKFKGKTSHLPCFENFDVIVTGDDPRIPAGRGKPCPDIWQLGLKMLNEKFGGDIKPSECLVFEDGIPGVKSGKAFGAHVIWVPHPEAQPYLGDVDGILDNKGELLPTLQAFKREQYGL